MHEQSLDLMSNVELGKPLHSGKHLREPSCEFFMLAPIVTVSGCHCAVFNCLYKVCWSISIM